MPPSFGLIPGGGEGGGGRKGRRPGRGKGAKDGPHHHDRRNAPRQETDKPVDARVLELRREIPLDARIADVSATGIGLRAARPVAPGKHIRLYPPGDPKHALDYRVVRCIELPNGDYHIGACFVRKPPTRRPPPT